MEPRCVLSTSLITLVYCTIFIPDTPNHSYLNECFNRKVNIFGRKIIKFYVLFINLMKYSKLLHYHVVGNKDTLSVQPKESGINVRDKLLEFHDKWYSANIMCLAVLGKGVYLYILIVKSIN